MANTTINIPRPHLIMGLCLPLAVLIGYFLAEPMDSGSIAVVVLVLAVLSVPVLMRWYHPLLLVSWNAFIVPSFLPGRPEIWMLVALVGLFFAVLNRSVTAKRPFISVPLLTKPLLFLTGVIILTMFLTGGFGLRMLGSEHYGGKGYFYLYCAVAGYFALTSQRIPSHRVGASVAFFFLSGVTALVPNLVFAAGSAFSFLYVLFPVETTNSQVAAQYALPGGFVRLGGLGPTATALSAYLLARYGLRGVLDLARPWRLLCFLGAVGACLACGYRSAMLLFALTVAAAFWLEGLWRTQLLPILAAAFLVVGLVAIPNTDRLPLVVQRTLSFLPVKIDPGIKSNAQDSTEWRLEMWKAVLPQVPKYLIKGKGYALDPNDLYMAVAGASRGLDDTGGSSAMVGDYHNGPLSVIIPFGIFGAIGFCWLLVAGMRVLYWQHKFGDPALRQINTFLLAAFVAKILLFFLIFGSFYNDLPFFLGTLGLSVSLNGPPRRSPEPESVEAEFAFSET